MTQKEKGTKWNVCIGVPYGTSYWQVGDSAEQNGCFKMYLSIAKTALLQKKSNARLTLTIKKTDIIHIMNEAWGKSFAHVLTNLKAIAECGWGPLNYNCLTNPEIQPKTTWQENDQNNIVKSAHLPAPVAPPEQFNVMNGVAIEPSSTRLLIWPTKTELKQGYMQKNRLPDNKKLPNNNWTNQKPKVLACMLWWESLPLEWMLSNIWEGKKTDR